MDQLLEQARQNLKHYWGYPDFREGQQRAVASVLEGSDTLVLFPTGGGKSLCYQVPATVFDGLTVVISPLVALMQDQVDQLKARGIKATFINSTLPKHEVEQRLINARNHMYKLVYCAPERLETELWKNMLTELPIEMIAVDEAHCISEWGHDFRPSYRSIKSAMEPVADQVRWMALTATATPEVSRDIQESLDLQKPEIISLGFDRPNLKWWVLEDEQKEKRLLDTINKAHGSGLVYAGTRNGCEYLAGRIHKLGISCKAYHAGLESSEREKIQQEWIDGTIRVVVATNAFGMGIDKPDCRFVIHFDIPYSIESYYQEAGRAGRDGKESYPILLCKKSDYTNAVKRIEESYPTREQLVDVYTKLCDIWQIAVGSVGDEPMPIDHRLLAERTSISEKSVRAAIRMLDRLGLIEIFQNHQKLIGLRFIATQGGLRDAIRRTSNPLKANFMDRLSRVYGPQSFLNTEYHSVDYLRQKLEHSLNSILRGLNVLREEQILSYTFVQDDPVGVLSVPRYRVFPFSRKELESHRKTLLLKLDRMITYSQTSVCRSRYLRMYFGEQNVPEQCGRCDNCLRDSKTASHQEVIKSVIRCLGKSSHSFDEIKSYTGYGRHIVQEAIDELLDEQVIIRAEDELIRYRLKEPGKTQSS